MYFVLVFCGIGVTIASRDTCTSPNGDQGTCQPLFECDVLRRIITKAQRTSIDEQYLRKSHCGFDEKIPKVCCPSTTRFSCSTPDGNKGECVNASSCPHLLELMEETNDTATQYVRNSACAGPSENAVCCSPTTPDLSEGLFEQCELTVTALPPDPDSDCCGIDSTVGDKIIGGNATAINEYPWLVVIEYMKMSQRRLLCGGALISGKYVLTAAHCVTGSILQNNVPKYVRLGEYNITNDGPDCVKVFGEDDCSEGIILAPIEELIPHPEYTGLTSEREHDIALIRIEVYAPYTDFIRPICLPKTNYLLAPPKNFFFYVAGWGRAVQTSGLYKNSDVKKHLRVPYVETSVCQAAVRTLPGVKDIIYGDGHICAGGVLGQSTCKGDSGGPLMYQGNIGKTEVIGIVSAGPLNCGREGVPTVYTYVYKYLPWIRETMKM